MNTELLCLENTYLFLCSAYILESGTKDDKEYLILDKTVFYPKGGGQPSDKGVVIDKNGKKFFVEKCEIIDSLVFHFGTMEEDFLLDDLVQVEIDEPARKLNAKIHSASHLIDGAMHLCDYQLDNIKGFSYPEGPYNEYAGNIDDIDVFIQKVNEKLDEIIKTDNKVSSELTQDKHENGKPNRVVTIDGVNIIPCGGTHVNSLSELIGLKIKKVKNYPNSVRISFTI